MTKYSRTADHSTKCILFTALSIKAVNWTKPKCPQTCGWIHRRRCIYTSPSLVAIHILAGVSRWNELFQFAVP